MDGGKGVTATFNQQVSNITLSAQQASPQAVNTVVNFTATPTGGATVEYQLWAYDYNGVTPTWRMVQDWQQSSILSWDTSKASGAGSYNIQVRARNVGSTAAYEARAFIAPYILTSQAPVSGITLSAQQASPQAVNTVVNFTATPTGGATVEYQLWVYDYNGVTPTWRMVQDWQQSSILSWGTSKASGAGSYNIQVRARNVGSTAAYEARAFVAPYSLF
jgi:uncharacterized protein YcfL